jgi:hypothetical protein
MARRIKDQNLETRSGRLRLKPRGKPYYAQVDPKLHAGYRRLPGGKSGTFCARLYVGKGAYKVVAIATADDLSDSNGIDVLSFHEAVNAARRLRDERARDHGAGGPLTVADAMKTHIAHLFAHKKTGQDATYSFTAHIEGPLGHIEVAKLTTPELGAWLANLAKQPARTRTRRGDAQSYRKHGMDDGTVRRRRSTANRIWKTLRAALNRAFHDGLVPSDLAWRRVEERMAAA